MVAPSLLPSRKLRRKKLSSCSSRTRGVIQNYPLSSSLPFWMLLISSWVLTRHVRQLVASKYNLQSSSILVAAMNTSCNAVIPHPVGLGTLDIARDKVRPALRSAILQAGYRRIDCAPVYFNEDAVGDALHEMIQGKEIARSDLFVVSKLPSVFHHNPEAAVRKTLLDLRLDYLDLYLIHWPVAFQPLPNLDLTVRGWKDEEIDESDNGKRIDPAVSVHDTWKAMEALVDKGLVKNIGVSNFPVMLLHELLSRKSLKIPPAVNQCEAHPYLPQTNLVKYCHSRNIHFQAYSPLGTPGYKEAHEPSLLQEPVLSELAAKYKVTAAQICLAWALQRGTSVVAKATSAEHQIDNLLVTSSAVEPSWRLSNDDMDRIKTLDRNHRFFRPEDWWGERAMAVFD